MQYSFRSNVETMSLDESRQNHLNSREIVEMDSGQMARKHKRNCFCNPCIIERQARRARNGEDNGGTMSATSFRDAAQRNDSTVTNTYFNTPGDGSAHGHVKHRDNPDGTTDYPFVRDVEGNEYDA